MIELGIYNTLRSARTTDFGMYLEDEEGNEVLLPNKYVPDDMLLDDEIEVFIYKDSEDRIVATTRKPKIMRNEFGFLKVQEVNAFGAFLDWGLEKDLLVPFREQKATMEAGNQYLVYLFVDEKTDRLVASAKIQRFFEKEDVELEVGEEVDLLIGQYTDLGVNVIINNKYSGLVFNSDLYKKVVTGDRRKGFIKNIREDKKIDVVFEKQGYQNIEPNAQKILEKLQEYNGFLDLNDKSHPAEIASRLEMSKKTFKKAIGGLYKKRIIRIEKDGIYLIKKED